MTIPGIYSQRDSRWSSLELGYNNDSAYNLYHYGCLVTAIANMLWYNGNNGADPGAVNNWLRDNGGFEAGGGNVIWAALRLLLDQVQMIDHGYSSNLDDVNNFLQGENNYAIAWITKPGFPQHWSVMPYVGQLADSWDGILKPVGSYTFHGAHLYSKVIPEPVVVPVPTIAVPEVQVAPPQQPIVAPTPEPVPSNPDPQPDPSDEAPQVSVTPTGQPSGDIPVRVVPEYIASFKQAPENIWLLRDTTAIDLTGENPPKNVQDFPDRPVAVTGTFTNSGYKYYKGTSTVGWYGIPAEDVDLPAPEEPRLSPLAWFIRLIAKLIGKKK